MFADISEEQALLYASHSNPYLGVQQQVLWLQVPIDNAPCMQALQRKQHIGGIKTGCCITERALNVQVVEQLPTRHPFLQSTQTQTRNPAIAAAVSKSAF